MPTSRRCTTPCRSAAPVVAMRKPPAARAPSTVGPSQPTEGCAATPEGLSTTTMSSSSYTIAEVGHLDRDDPRLLLGRPRRRRATRRRAACRTSTSTRPSMLTPPASATSAAKVREKPSIFASAASTRVPSSPSGTGRLRDSTSVLRRGARRVVGGLGRRRRRVAGGIRSVAVAGSVGIASASARARACRRSAGRPARGARRRSSS